MTHMTTQKSPAGNGRPARGYRASSEERNDVRMPDALSLPPERAGYKHKVMSLSRSL
jgi:hypothetical protein